MAQPLGWLIVVLMAFLVLLETVYGGVGFAFALALLVVPGLLLVSIPQMFPAGRTVRAALNDDQLLLDLPGYRSSYRYGQLRRVKRIGRSTAIRRRVGLMVLPHELVAVDALRQRIRSQQMVRP